jgi:hypothetical protein
MTRVSALKAALDDLHDPRITPFIDPAIIDGQIDDLRVKLADLGTVSITPTGAPVSVKVSLNTDEADAQMRDLAARLRLLDTQVRVGLDPADADARIQALQARLAGLAYRSPVITPDVRIADAEAKLAALQARLDALKGTSVTPTVNTGGIDKASQSAEQASGWMGLLIAGAVTVAPALITAGTAAGIFGAAAIPTLERASKGTGSLAGQLAMLKGEWRGLEDAVHPQVIADADIALEQASRIIPELTGVARAGGDAVGGLLSQFGSFLHSGDTQGFLSFVRDQAAPDTAALGHVLDGTGSAVEGLTEDINPLAKAVLNAAGGILEFTGDVARSQPGLVEWAAGAALAGFALVKVGEGFAVIKGSALVTWFASAGAAVTEFVNASVTAAATEMLVAASADPVTAAWIAQVGAAAALDVAVDSLTESEIALIAAQSALDLVSPWMWVAAAVAGVAALTYGVVRLTGGGETLTQQLTDQYQATGYNISGYQHLATALDAVAAANVKAAGSNTRARESAELQNLAISQSATAAEQKALNLNAALNQLQAMYGISRAKAVSLAEGVKGSAQAFGEGGNAAQQMMAKVQGYAVAGAHSSTVTTQLAVDWSIANDDAAGLTTRVLALTNALAAESGATDTAGGNIVSFHQGLVTLQADMVASGDKAGYFTKAGQATAAELFALDAQAKAASEGILQTGGSSAAAAGPLEALRGELEKIQDPTAAEKELLRELNAEIAQLHSKTIIIGLHIDETTSGNVLPAAAGAIPHLQAAGGAVVPGTDRGRDTVHAMVRPEEAIMVPEFTRAHGPDQIMRWNREYAAGRRGPVAASFGNGGVVTAAGISGDTFNVFLSLLGPDAGKPSPAGVSAANSIAQQFADISGASVTTIRSDEQQALKDLAQYYAGPHRKELAGVIRDQTTVLSVMSRTQADINSTIKGMRQYSKQEISSLQGFSALSSIPVTAGVNGTTAPTAAGIASGLKADLTALRKFDQVIGELKDHHVARALIGQVIGMGPVDGITYGEAILHGGKHLIGELDKYETEIGRTDTAIGHRAAEIKYGQSISKGFLSGLEEDKAELAHRMRELGDEIARELLAALHGTVHVGGGSASALSAATAAGISTLNGIATSGVLSRTDVNQIEQGLRSIGAAAGDAASKKQADKIIALLEKAPERTGHAAGTALATALDGTSRGAAQRGRYRTQPRNI